MNKQIKFLFLISSIIFSSIFLTIVFSYKSSTNYLELDHFEELTPKLSNQNNVSKVIVFFNSSNIDNGVKANFTFYGGNIDPTRTWDSTFVSFSGFVGEIPTINISSFRTYLDTQPNASFELDEIIETQMTYAALQTGAINFSWYLDGYKGNINSSVAVLDSGIMTNHSYFPNNFNFTNLSGNIVGWDDFVNDREVPYDDNGHGTFISATISGTGNTSYNSPNPNVINIYGNYSHTDLFKEYTPSKNYTFKIFSFNATNKANPDIIIDSTWFENDSLIDGFWVELFRDDNLVKRSYLEKNNTKYSLSYDLSNTNQGIYDIFLKYHKIFNSIPEFSFNVNISFYAESYVKNYSYFTGLTNASKIVSYKVLNQSGLGFASDLITALESVVLNRNKYHIVSVCLSIGTLGEKTNAINNVINEVIKNGTLVIIAAGNYGVKTSNQINKLALNENAIVVGAINDEDQITSYSSVGKDIGKSVIKPDIVAPGGSKISGHRSIISADFKYNQSTTLTGTSISAAIVSGAINILIEAICENWTQWNELNLTKWVKKIKAMLLMTASETNLNREDDPLTGVDESNYSPQLSTSPLISGIKDIHEGYGRINVQAAVDALTKRMKINETINGTLTSSQTNSLGTHVFARRINFTANQQYLFNLTEVSFLADFDMYLFSNESNQYGEPILLASSRRYFGDFDYMHFTPKPNQTECIITVKAISGTSFFNLSVKNLINSYSPNLGNPEVNFFDDNTKNTTVLSAQEFYLGELPEKNYTLDNYFFFVKYSDNDTTNAPPQEVTLTIVEKSRNYPLNRYNPSSEDNFSRGVVYWSEQIEFITNGTYHYFFNASDGKHNIGSKIYNITIELPLDSISIPCAYTFNHGLPTNWIIKGTGWGILNQNNSYDNRSRIRLDSWKALYFGSRHYYPQTYTYQPILVSDPYPNGTVTSPIFNLTQINTNKRILLGLGVRQSINSGDFIYLRVRTEVDWTNWSTVKTFSDVEKEWFLEEIDITKYGGRYLQFRFEASNDEEFDPINYKGFMLDYFAIKYYTNVYRPKILFNYTTNIFPKAGSVYQTFTFSCEYYDLDNNYPEFVYLEINNSEYEMLNTVGDWNARSELLNEKGILFSRSLNLRDISNKTFRFRASDGEYENFTIWFNTDDTFFDFIDLKSLDYNYYENEKLIGYQFSNNSLDDYFVTGTPLPKESTTWLMGDNTWHPMVRLDKNWLYCGNGNSYGSGSQGYGLDWEANLITRPLYIGGDYDSILYFEHEISLENEFNVEEDLDMFTVSISQDYGDNWEIIEEFTYENEDLSGNKTIDISDYTDKNIMIKFTLHSNDNQVGQGYGCILSGIYLGYDKSSDFIAPEINFLNLQENDEISSLVIVSIEIYDDVELDVSRIQICVDDVSVDPNDFNYYENTTILLLKLDTTAYNDGIRELKVVAFDKEGNKAEKRINVNINNGILIWNFWAPWIVLFAIIAVTSFFSYLISKKWAKVWVNKIRSNYAEKLRIKEIDKDQVIKRIEELESELMQNPLTLHCKFCKSWFTSREFHIICPICGRDKIYATYNCLNCGKWSFKDEPSDNYYCDKCETVKLVKRNTEEIRNILNEEGNILREYERKKSDFSILDL